VTAVLDSDGQLVGFAKISRDLTERRSAAEAAERVRMEAERDAVRGMLAAAEERERLRLARELHDVLGQSLTALSLELKVVESHTREPEDAERLMRVRALLASTSAQAHSIAQSLRPVGLVHLGLRHVLDAFGREWADRTGVALDVQLAGEEMALPPESEAALYRIAQEALTNVAKHAQATRASLVLGRVNGEVRLIVEDDGRGFDVEAAFARGPAEGRLGLVGMRERAALAGGSVEMESSRGVGTTLLVRLPATRRA
jgi:signal transduction histidine kinase